MSSVTERHGIVDTVNELTKPARTRKRKRKKTKIKTVALLTKHKN